MEISAPINGSSLQANLEAPISSTPIVEPKGKRERKKLGLRRLLTEHTSFLPPAAHTNFLVPEMFCEAGGCRIIQKESNFKATSYNKRYYWLYNGEKLLPIAK